MARIVTGKLRLEMAPVDLVAATLAAVDVVTPVGAWPRTSRSGSARGPGRGSSPATPDRMQQIAWNVLSNAVKFTPSGGTITVRIEQDGACDSPDRHGQRQGHRARFPAVRLRAIPPGQFVGQPDRGRAGTRPRAGAATGRDAWRPDRRRQPGSQHGIDIHHHVARDRSRARRSRCVQRIDRFTRAASAAGSWSSMMTATGATCWCRCCASTARTSGPPARRRGARGCSTRPRSRAPARHRRRHRTARRGRLRADSARARASAVASASRRWRSPPTRRRKTARKP